VRCTDCHRPVRPVVALDIDGTLGDYHGHFLRFVNAYLGLDGFVAVRYDGSVNFGDWVCDTFGVSRRTYRDIKLAYRQGAQKRSMPVFAGAWEVAYWSKLNGAEVWLTTSRPYLRLDNVDPDTRFWLDQHHIQYDHMLYDEHKYQVLAGLVEPERVCAVLDDLTEQLFNAAAEFGSWVPILRENSWNNAAVWNGARVSDLAKAWEAIRTRIDRWNLQHDNQPQTAV
jgi:hypothetical protein